MTRQIDIFDADPEWRAEFSPCRLWRYTLRRRWNAGKTIGFLLLNPSTADEIQDDPTIRRCIGFAKSLGAGAMILGNIFAYRATKPADMKAFANPVGPENDAAIMQIAKDAELGLICGWGAHGSFNNRDVEIHQLLQKASVTPMCLGVTVGGQPKHPLYIAGATRPKNYVFAPSKK